jgi:hypothetical protein
MTMSHQARQAILDALRQPSGSLCFEHDEASLWTNLDEEWVVLDEGASRVGEPRARLVRDTTACLVATVTTVSGTAECFIPLTRLDVSRTYAYEYHIAWTDDELTLTVTPTDDDGEPTQSTSPFRTG